MPAFSLPDLLARRRPNTSLERPFYTDADIFNHDITRIHRAGWLYAGHISQLPNPGDFFLFEFAGESLIIIRDQSNHINALHNSCRHRGSAICTEAQGHARKLVCPYHQWIYDADGCLLAAPHAPNIRLDDFPLHRAPCEVLEGFIFISFSHKPPSFDQLRTDLAPFLAPHDPASAKIAFTHTYDVNANWKLIVENSRECYHCRIGHPEYTRIMLAEGQNDSTIAGMEGGAGAGAGVSCSDHIAERLAHYEQLGLKTRRVEAGFYFASRYPLARRGAVTESKDGKPVAPIMGSFKEPDAGVLGLIVHPTFMLEATSDYVMTLRFLPVHATLTRIRVDWLVRCDALEGRDYHLDDLTFFWKRTAEQDWKLCENNQHGVNSSRYTPGPYTDEESGVEEFVGWYLQQIA